MKRFILYNYSQNDSINICHFVCWHILDYVDQSRVIKRRNIIQAPGQLIYSLYICLLPAVKSIIMFKKKSSNK
jgi:hypothetical protein